MSSISEKVAQDIVAATELHLANNKTIQSLAEALTELRQMAGVYEALDGAPSRADLRRKTEAIRKSSWRLAQTLGVLDGADLRDANPSLFELLCGQAQRHAEALGAYSGSPATLVASGDGQWLDFQPGEAVLRAVEGARRLWQWADALEKLLVGQPAQGGTPFERWLIGDELPAVYESFFGRDFGITKDSSGPAVRFVNAVLTAFGYPEKSPNAIELHWDRSRKDFTNCAR